jgi:hypothetical protein
MALIKNNDLLTGLGGAIGKQLVVRVRNGKTFVSKYPDMSKVRPSVKQRKEKSRFAKAVSFAKTIITNPAKKAAYKVKKGQSVYNTAISDYLKQN